jgi:hypothetical protein
MHNQITLNALVDAIVQTVDEAIGRDEELSADEIRAAVLAQYPRAPEDLLQLAFRPAAQRLRDQARRDHAHADALQRHFERRGGPGSGG